MATSRDTARVMMARVREMVAEDLAVQIVALTRDGQADQQDVAAVRSRLGGMLPSELAAWTLIVEAAEYAKEGSHGR